MPDLLAIAPETNTFAGAQYEFSFEPNGVLSPLKVQGIGIKSITYLATGIWLVTFMSNFAGIAGISAQMMNTAGGAGQGYLVEVDQDNSNLGKAGGAVLALASVLASSGARAAITADAKCRVFIRVTFSKNGTLVPGGGP